VVPARRARARSHRDVAPATRPRRPVAGRGCLGSFRGTCAFEDRAGPDESSRKTLATPPRHARCRVLILRRGVGTRFRMASGRCEAPKSWRRQVRAPRTGARSGLETGGRDVAEVRDPAVNGGPRLWRDVDADEVGPGTPAGRRRDGSPLPEGRRWRLGASGRKARRQILNGGGLGQGRLPQGASRVAGEPA